MAVSRKALHLPLYTLAGPPRAHRASAGARAPQGLLLAAPARQGRRLTSPCNHKHSSCHQDCHHGQQQQQQQQHRTSTIAREPVGEQHGGDEGYGDKLNEDNDGEDDDDDDAQL